MSANKTNKKTYFYIEKLKSYGGTIFHRQRKDRTYPFI